LTEVQVTMHVLQRQRAFETAHRLECRTQFIGVRGQFRDLP
jgi:hypothetical protein